MKNIKNQRGAVLLIFVVILLFAITAVVFMLAKNAQLMQKSVANDYQAEQAFEASEAGLEFGIIYLGKNNSTIIKDANADGYIDNFSNSSISNVSLANGSKYTITYSNPNANDFSIVQITSVGTSADGIATREIRQMVKFTSTLTHYSNYSTVVKGNFSLAGNTVVTNTNSNNTIQTGGSVTFNGNAKTVISSGNSSSASSTKSDVSQNNTSLSSESAETLFTSFFGVPSGTVKSGVANYYQNNTDTSYNSILNGKTGTSIWIEQTGGTQATINGNTVIGSAAAPVLLIINGNLTLNGNAVIYGFIYVTDSLLTGSGNAIINGGLVVGGNASDSGNFSVNYNNSVLTKIQQQIGNYGKIAGSWDDFKQ